ncbi:MAG: hypothetical protein PHY43_12940 [Verrucomicrobiales bacterium]|nr:hypothetical protein [Verrucomicrobiales bacterium]
MKRWAVLTVLLYALALLVLTAPVVLIAFGNWGKNENNIGLHEVFQMYSSWGYWLWFGILVAGQALLLLLPINIAERRLPSRRPLKIPVIVTAFFLANLFIAGTFSLLCVAFHDDAFYCFSFVDWLCGHVAQNADGQPGSVQTTNWGTFSSITIVVIFFWVIWAFIFRRFAKADDEISLTKRATRWLLRGSILELLVAVPSHVIVRRRDDCCAPAGTLWGIATGISVMLLCFGPGVYFLFVERCRKLKPKPADADKQV